jgi:hypothetical protein
MPGTRSLLLGAGLGLLCLVRIALVPAQAYPNVKVNTLANDPEETAIAINPVRPENIVGVAQSPCRYYASSDAGSTWAEGQLPDPFDLGDPSIVFDRQGNAYYCYIGLFSHSGIFINKSTDGGLSWRPSGTAVIEHAGDTPFEDKSYPVCDWTDGPHSGSIYVAWTQFDHYGSANPADSSRILFARSTDGGLSFSAPLRVSDRGGDAVDADNTVEGAVPSVGPDGTVYLAWAGPRGIEFDRSTDGGASFGADQVLTGQPGGWDFAVPGIYRCNGLPLTKVDLSNSPYRGRLYVCWSDHTYGDVDIFLLHSDDRGTTWSPRVRVNGDAPGTGRDQFFPWLDVDPVTGQVWALFYDHPSPSSLDTDVTLAVSGDGGDHFSSLTVSASSFVPDSTVFFGDYIGLSAYNGRVRPLWMRMDQRRLSIWTALIDTSVTGVETALLVTPNPARDQARIIFGRGLELPAGLEILDVAGRLVRTLPLDGNAAQAREVFWDATDSGRRPVASGVYFLRGGGRDLGRAVIVR